MREYIPKKNNPCKLPKEVYYQALYAAKDYDRLKGEYADILHGYVTVFHRQSRTNAIGDSTERKAERLSAISDRIAAIERALRQIPEEYRAGTFNNIRYGAPYPYIAGSSTWGRWRRTFLFLVAENLDIY